MVMAEESSDVQRVLDRLPLGVLIIRQPEGAISYLNEMASELLQMPTESAVGLRGFDFLVAEEERIGFAKELMGKGRGTRTRVLCRAMSGREFRATLSAAVVTFGDSPSSVVVLSEVQPL
jgi:nitrogen fixation/metabolism regulation signal transduction histidine kinase